MNYLQNSIQTNSFQRSMQKNTLNRFLQPQLLCIDQQSINISSTALLAVNVQASQKFQRGSRQYIIKSRNQNAAATSISQSPQKITIPPKNQNIMMKMMCINTTEDASLKENKNIPVLSVKVSKIANVVVSPCSSLSTQSSNKNDQAPTDKEDDSPLRINRLTKQDTLSKPLCSNNLIEKTSISTNPPFEQPLKHKSKNSSSVYFQSENQQKKQFSPEPMKQLMQDDKKWIQEQDFMSQIYADNSYIQQNQERGTLRKLNKITNISINSTAAVNIKNQKLQESTNDYSEQVTFILKNREESAPPLKEVMMQNPKTIEQNKIQFHKTMQQRSPILKVSNPMVVASELTPDIYLNEINQQTDFKLLSSTLQKLKLEEEASKKQIMLNKGKKNTFFLSSKRKKLKKKQNTNFSSYSSQSNFINSFVTDKNKQSNDNKDKTSIRTSFLNQQQGQYASADERGDFKEQDFQSLSDQLENQQLIEKIDGHNYMMDDDNDNSEEYDEQENESRKDLMLNFNRDNNKQIKTNNSITLPSLGSNNIMEEHSELILRSKELESLNLTAKSVCIFDVEKNKSILSLKGKKSREVASLTKIMTCFIVCQAITKKKIKQTEIIKVSRAAASMIGTSAYLRSGDQLTVWDLLHGLMLPSGNDAAFALAEYMGRLMFFDNEDYKKQLQQNPHSFDNCKTRDAIKCFLQEMNRVAKELKLTSTKYTNPHGLVNKSNRSSAVDICKLSAYCLKKSSIFRQIVKTKLYTCQVVNKQGAIRISNWENTNKCLLRYSKICEGVKTGVTCTAGPCLTTSWNIKDRQFIITILKCDSLEQRYSESHKVFVWMCEKLGIELAAEEKMPYEKVKLLYKRNSIESISSPKESNTSSNLSLKIKPNFTLTSQEISSIQKQNIKPMQTYLERDY